MRDCLSEEVKSGSAGGHRPLPRERLGVNAVSILDCIGNTPLFRLCKLTAHLKHVELYAKAEYLNPGGPVRRRIAWWFPVTAVAERPN